MISDEAATVGDTVVIDAVADAIRIAGLATGTITYRTDGTFADGITVWTGSGADTISISATHRAAGVRTVTFLNTGLGNDVVTVDLTAGEDDLLVLDTQGGVDHVLPIGGSDVASVSVDGLTLAPAAWVAYNGSVGLLNAPQPGSTISVTWRTTTIRAYRLGATGVIATGLDLKAGDVVTATVNGIAVSVLGMDANADTVTRGRRADGALVVLTVVSFTTQTFGAPQTPLASDDDTVHGENSTLPPDHLRRPGQRHALRRQGRRRRSSATAAASSRAATSSATAASATRTDGLAHAGQRSSRASTRGSAATTRSPRSGADDVLIGGSGADTIVAGDGANIVFGDNGRVDVAAQDASRRTDPDVRRQTTTITAGDGRDVLLGGAGARHDRGRRRRRHRARRPRRASARPAPASRTSDFNDGGRDRLEGGDGDDLLIGGTAGDTIDGDAGNDLIFGDQVSLDGRTILDLFHSLAHVGRAGARRASCRATATTTSPAAPATTASSASSATTCCSATARSRTRPRARRASPAPATRSARSS